MKNRKTVKVRGLVIGQGVPKICVPIVGKTKKEIEEAASKMQENGSDLAEWRADYFDGVQDFKEVKEVLASLRRVLGEKPLLFTFRTKREGGEKEIGKEAYETLLNNAAATGLVDLLDVEVFFREAPEGENRAERMGFTSEEIEEKKRFLAGLKQSGTAVVGSNHDFQATPASDEMTDRLKIMEELGTDIAKLAVMPKNRDDVERLLCVTKKAFAEQGVPIITMSMGKLGEISRIAGGDYGSAVTFGSGEKASAPGQLMALDLRERLYVRGKNLFLIGFMGCGKSTVSSVLSESLGNKWVEMDAVLAEREQMSISDIFAAYGEEYFRQKESGLIQECAQENGVIVSCGGGAVLREKNTDIMKKAGEIILLTASPETIYERVKDSSERPLLNSDRSLSHIKELMGQRDEKYRLAATVTVATDGKTAEEIAAEIRRRLFSQCGSRL